MTMRMAGPLSIIIMSAVTIILYVLAKPDPSIFLASPFLFLSRVSALVGAALLSAVFLLSTRWRVLEQAFGGLDKVYRAHGITAAIAFTLLLEHVSFLIVHYLPNLRIVRGFILPGGNTAYTMGIISIWGFAFLVFLTLYVNLPYHIWRNLHAYMGVPYAFGIMHMLLIPSDISRFPPLRIWMLGIAVAGFAAYLYKRFLYSIVGPQYAYSVRSVTRIGDVLDIRLAPEAGKLVFIPGQFVFLTVKKPGLEREEHPFSISSGPGEDGLRLLCKITGDYTLSLLALVPGDRVSVSGPYGMFGRNLKEDRPVIMIAGGIGITPFLSMISACAGQARTHPIYLFHTVRKSEESVNHDELNLLAGNNGSVRYYRHVTSERGRLNARQVIETTGLQGGFRVLLCGPGQMMYDMSRQFAALGIRRRQIEFEDFNFR